MNWARPRLLVAIIVSGWLVVSVCPTSRALVMTREGCTWPADWPKALDEVRGSCRTIEMMAGNQENVYEIVFEDREKFERLWPVVLSLRTSGAPLRLFRVDGPCESSLFSNAKPTVRIFAPAYGAMTVSPLEAGSRVSDYDRLVREGKALRPTPPWPAEIVGTKGELPQYVQVLVVEGRMTWVPADRHGLERGFLHRARVDLELVVDGEVIDLSRLHLPSDAPIIDRRYDLPPDISGPPFRNG